MAVDVPDSFVARNKTPPRYPPPSRSSPQVIHIDCLKVQNNVICL